mmetsp:Transcript_70226/g.198204  ORF Transcript_70226/g.198204 Transcript_70226/m.198204 type:complete len:467 (-) Transcript_70226:33-1433(-)
MIFVDVGPRLVFRHPVVDAIPNFRRVHPGERVPVELPDTPERMVAVDDQHVLPLAGQVLPHVDPGDAGADDEDLYALGQGGGRVADVRKGCVLLPAAVLRARLGDAPEHGGVDLVRVALALHVVVELLRLADLDELELVVLGVLLPGFHLLRVREVVLCAVVAARDDRDGELAALRVLAEVVEEHHSAVGGHDLLLVLVELVQLVRPAVGTVGLVGLREEVRRRAVRHHQRAREVARLYVVVLDPLDDLVRDYGAHALPEPDRVDPVAEREHVLGDLHDHLLEVRPALPADDPEVHLVLRLDVVPRVHLEGAVVPELGREEEHAVLRRVLGRHDLLRDHRAGGPLLPRVLYPPLLVAAEHALRLAHLLGRLAEHVLEGGVLLLGPGSRADEPIHRVPLALVLVEPAVRGPALADPPPHLVDGLPHVLGVLHEPLHRLHLLRLQDALHGRARHLPRYVWARPRCCGG